MKYGIVFPVKLTMDSADQFGHDFDANDRLLELEFQEVVIDAVVHA